MGSNPTTATDSYGVDMNRPIILKSVTVKGKLGGENEVLTTCTDCRRYIFKSQKYQWTNRGLVHKECIDEETDASSNAT